MLAVMTLTLYSLKPSFQRLLRPIARCFVRAGISPNQVTIFTCLMSLAASIAIIRRPSPGIMLAIPLVLLARMALNAIDGIMARDFGLQSSLGVYLNELGDVLSDVFLLAAFPLAGIFDPWWMFLVVVLCVVSEMTGTIAVLAGGRRRYDGPLGKSDRAMVFGAFGLWLGTGGSLPSFVEDGLPVAVALGLILTIFNRVQKGIQDAHSQHSTLHN